MGGVYRIQLFFDFYIFFYIYKAPKRTRFAGEGVVPEIPIISSSGPNSVWGGGSGTHLSGSCR